MINLHCSSTTAKPPPRSNVGEFTFMFVIAYSEHARLKTGSVFGHVGCCGRENTEINSGPAHALITLSTGRNNKKSSIFDHTRFGPKFIDPCV